MPAALLLGLGLGLVTLDGGFVYDDKQAIASNPVVRGSVPASESFARDFWGTPLGDEKSHSFRPLLPLLWRGLWAIFPDQPLPFRVLSLVSHLLAVLAFAWVMRRVRVPPWQQGVALVLFACHAAHAEALGSMVAQADVLSAAAGLLAVALSTRVAGLAGACGVAGVLLLASLIKESAFIFAGAAMAIMALRPGVALRRRALWVAPSALVTLTLIAGQLLLLRFLLQRAGETGFSNSIAYDAHGMSALWLGLAFISRGTVLSLLPTGLSPDHSYAAWDLSLETLLPHAVPGVLLSALIVGGLVAALRSRNPHLIVGAVLFCGPILLNSGLLVQVPDELPERTFYPATMGAALGYAGALSLLGRRLPRVNTAALPVIAVLMTLQHVRAQRPWVDELSLWQYALSVEPKSEKMHMFMGYHHRDAGQLVAAAYHFAVTAYIVTERPHHVDFAPVRELQALPMPQRWLAAPVAFSEQQPCRFVLGLLVIYRERMPDFEAQAFSGYRERYPACFAAPARPGAALNPVSARSRRAH